MFQEVKRSVERPAGAVRCPCRLLLGRRGYRAQYGTHGNVIPVQQLPVRGRQRDGTHCRPDNRWIRAISPLVIPLHRSARPPSHGHPALQAPGTGRRRLLVSFMSPAASPPGATMVGSATESHCSPGDHSVGPSQEPNGSSAATGAVSRPPASSSSHTHRIKGEVSAWVPGGFVGGVGSTPGGRC